MRKRLSSVVQRTVGPLMKAYCLPHPLDSGFAAIACSGELGSQNIFC